MNSRSVAMNGVSCRYYTIFQDYVLKAGYLFGLEENAVASWCRKGGQRTDTGCREGFPGAACAGGGQRLRLVLMIIAKAGEMLSLRRLTRVR